jgi:hypothetical protein
MRPSEIGNFGSMAIPVHCHSGSARVTKGLTAIRRKQSQRLSDELAATTAVTAERKAAVTLSNAYNWNEWTYDGFGLSPSSH